MVAHGAPETLVSDSGGIFQSNQARALYRAFGIQKVEIERGQPWQNSIETHFAIMRRMADHDFARGATWPELRAAHERFFTDDHHYTPRHDIRHADGQ